MRTLPTRVVEVPAAHEGRRLDKFLRANLKGVPPPLLFRLLRKGRVRVNGRRVEPGYRLHDGDQLELPRMEVIDTKPPARIPAALLRQIEQSILHEDDTLIVLNKPADVAVHVGTGVSGGVIEVLRHLRPDQPDLELAHRLDRETSGLLMIAKTPAMLRHLQQVLRDSSSLDRRYIALVRGAWPTKLTEVRARLRRTERTVLVDGDGQTACTRFSILRRFGNRATLVQARLVTGRKHQIRVHTRHAGHPIAGDQKYGDDSFHRSLRELGGSHMFLHASELRIPLPGGEKLHLTAPTPPSWQRPLDLLTTPGKRAPRPRRRNRV
ncbi:RluA family pseudouridine synthase [Corynebacterium halotolerans]|uniref:RluA family pseudouridine synthase n=1 Tax=Corynebacterium halotolerans TaxID=225326 RepID=UPI000B1DAF76|nr:RluA family pseudouridine synthase [Corynebacterium halotolerans]